MFLAASVTNQESFTPSPFGVNVFGMNTSNAPVVTGATITVVCPNWDDPKSKTVTIYLVLLVGWGLMVKLGVFAEVTVPGVLGSTE